MFLYFTTRRLLTRPLQLSDRDDTSKWNFTPSHWQYHFVFTCSPLMFLKFMRAKMETFLHIPASLKLFQDDFTQIKVGGLWVKLSSEVSIRDFTAVSCMRFICDAWCPTAKNVCALDTFEHWYMYEYLLNAKVLNLLGIKARMTREWSRSSVRLLVWKTWWKSTWAILGHHARINGNDRLWCLPMTKTF